MPRSRLPLPIGVRVAATMTASRPCSADMSWFRSVRGRAGRGGEAEWEVAVQATRGQRWEVGARAPSEGRAVLDEVTPGERGGGQHLGVVEPPPQAGLQRALDLPLHGGHGDRGAR